MAWFEIAKSDIDLIKIRAKKYKNSVYANMILQHLTSTTQDFDVFSETIAKVQQLTDGLGVT
jgi:hypothetical protein